MPADSELDTYFSTLNKAAKEELTTWTKVWPPSDALNSRLVNLRTETAKAALRYVNLAESKKIEVCDNVRTLSKETTQAAVQQAVNETYASIKAGKLTKAQLEAKFVFDKPTAPAAPPIETGSGTVAAKSDSGAGGSGTIASGATASSHNDKALDDALSSLRTTAKSELSEWTKSWPPADALSSRLATMRVTTAAAALKYVNLADSKKAAVSDDARTISKQTAQPVAREAVTNTLASIKAGKLTKAQFEASFEFRIPAPAEPEKPGPGAGKPDPEPEKPGPGAGKPDPEPEKPDPGTEKPDPEPEKPDPEPEKPDPEPEKPDPGTEKPDPEAGKPDQGVTKPDQGVTKPDQGVTKPDQGVTKPDQGVTKPDQGVTKPDQGVTKPDQGVTKPDQGVTKPGSDAPKTAVGEFYSDIADILNSLGQGLSNAQRQLDIGAMQTQKEILEDGTLSGYGLTANWYVIPEAEFNMFMELGVSSSENVKGELEGGRVASSGTKVVAALTNAKYDSLYKTESKQESSLRVKFVPVPMPAVVKVPRVIGLTPAAARVALAAAEVKSRFIDKNGEIWDEIGNVLVSAQSIPGGEVMLAEKTLLVTVTAAAGKK